MKFVEACKKVFGIREGQSPMDFLKEVKQLTPQDRQDLLPGLSKAVGEEVEA